MILTDTLSGTEPPLAAVGVENSVYLQVQTDGRISSWSKHGGVWNIISIVGAGAFGGLRNIDLGMVNLRDAAIYGRSRTLIPYAEGRLIKSIQFVPGGDISQLTSDYLFATPNTSPNSGIGKVGSAGTAIDTANLAAEQTPLFSGSATSQIADCAPLYIGTELDGLTSGPAFTQFVSWHKNTAFCLNDLILDSNGNIQQISTNGVTGSSQPTWATVFGDPTTDGTATWTCFGAVPEGEVHVIAEVAEGVSPMPSFPETMEFVAPPANVAHGVTMAPITILVRNQFGQPYQRLDSDSSGVQIVLAIYGAGTLNGTVLKATNAATGIATWNDLSITEAHNGYVLRARVCYPIVADIFSPPFNVT